MALADSLASLRAVSSYHLMKIPASFIIEISQNLLIEQTIVIVTKANLSFPFLLTQSSLVVFVRHRRSRKKRKRKLSAFVSHAKT